VALEDPAVNVIGCYLGTDEEVDMSAPATRARSFFPLDWVSLPKLGGPEIRIEEFVDGETYVVRAELPGVDPQRDVHLAIVDAQLRIRVDRSGNRVEKGHTEFRYGSFYRAVPLPAGAREDSVIALYDRGILDVRVQLGAPELRGREIPVKTATSNGHR
jgi:HSP20 family protein